MFFTRFRPKSGLTGENYRTKKIFSITFRPIDPTQLPKDIIETVITMKGWIVKVLKVLSRDQLDNDGLARLVDIMLGYLDGEVFNLINGRFLPGEDVAGRVVDNLDRLFTLLTAQDHDGIVLAKQAAQPGALSFPTLTVP